MANTDSTLASGNDLLSGVPPRRRNRLIRHKEPAELTNARALCRQMHRKHTAPEKKRIAHLICLNLVTMLRHGTPHC